jgi:murein tripeptide amidase MpaA
MRIEVPPDSGNVEVLDLSDTVAQLVIRPDNAANFRQWFYFRCAGVQGRPLDLRLLNARTCSYPRGWPGYRAVASYDGLDWFRVPTQYVEGQLHISHTPEQDSVEYAYFAPYLMSRRQAHARRVEQRGGLVERLTVTPDGHDLLHFQIGTGPLPVWIVARQHSGETMAEWFVEGLTERWLDPEDPVASQLRSQATLHLVPCVNPDGAHRGNHRTNAHGMDLNRAWLSPDPLLAPEVEAILRRMDETGAVLALDIHGDEEIPHNFASGGEGTPSWDPVRAARKAAFLQRWVETTPEFQTRHGYPTVAPGEANLAICSHQLTERFRCLALTIESPFLDHDDQPDPRTGWSPARAQRLGASVLGPILADLQERA